MSSEKIYLTNKRNIQHTFNMTQPFVKLGLLNGLAHAPCDIPLIDTGIGATAQNKTNYVTNIKP